MSESFMLVSLKEEKAKKLANVMSNPTCTKLLDHLAKQGHDTESSIAKALKLPLSTVHYNLKQLREARLVVADEYHYSEKGREVLHYKLANKYIIIAPQEGPEGFLERLKGFLPAAAITVALGAALKLFGMFTPLGAPGERTASALPEPSMAAAPLKMVAEESAQAAGAIAAYDAAVPFAREAFANASNATRVVTETVVVTPPFLSNEVILAFLVGAFLALAVLFAWRSRRR